MTELILSGKAGCIPFENLAALTVQPCTNPESTGYRWSVVAVPKNDLKMLIVIDYQLSYTDAQQALDKSKKKFESYMQTQTTTEKK